MRRASDPPELCPVEGGPPDLGSYAGPAGGFDAIRVTARHALEKPGLLRGARALLRVNQPSGFDCPSCAWPDPAERAALEFCENGAKAVADEATRARVTPEFFAQWSVEALARQSDAWLNAQGRITEPMLLRADATHYEPIAWEDAFERLGSTLRSLSSPDRAVFYTSGRCSNEAAFLYQLFVRRYGTNNLPDCSNMCHESSGAGMSESLGVGKGTVLLEDFAEADAIFVLGQNPGTNHPRMLSALREAKRRGCKIVAINPLQEAGLTRFAHPQKLLDVSRGGVELTDLHLRVHIGGDIAVLTGIMKAMLEREREAPGRVFDHAFLTAHTRGYEVLVRHLDRVPWATIVAESGVPEPQIRAAAEIAIASRATIACWGMGLTQHRHGVANVQTVVNFLLLRGNIGRPGAGACPVRGHSNVQGDRTMGIWHHAPPWIERLERHFAFRAPRTPGLDTVAAIQAMHAGAVDVFFALGGNFLSASPDTTYTAEGLRRCRITAHVSTKLNRAHLVTGREALILPCLGRTERDLRGGRPACVSVENSMGVVHRSAGVLPPASPHLRSEVEIVARLARATLTDTCTVGWEAFAEDYDRIRQAIEAVVPGCEGLRARIERDRGFVLPNPARDRKWRTRSGKAELVPHPLPELARPAGAFWLTTIRSHDQFNTTIYGLDDRYRGIWGHRRVVLMHEDDMTALGIHSGDAVDLRSHFQGEVRRAPRFTAVAYDIPRGNVAAYFPEANVLVPIGSHAEVSRTPTSKAIVVTIEPAANAVL